MNPIKLKRCRVTPEGFITSLDGTIRFSICKSLIIQLTKEQLLTNTEVPRLEFTRELYSQHNLNSLIVYCYVELDFSIDNVDYLIQNYKLPLDPNTIIINYIDNE